MEQRVRHYSPYSCFVITRCHPEPPSPLLSFFLILFLLISLWYSWKYCTNQTHCDIALDLTNCFILSIPLTIKNDTFITNNVSVRKKEMYCDILLFKCSNVSGITLCSQSKITDKLSRNDTKYIQNLSIIIVS